jgi:hypothetical protein
MAILKCLTIIAVLLAGATSVAIAQNGLPTGGEHLVAGGAAGGPYYGYDTGTGPTVIYMRTMGLTTGIGGITKRCLTRGALRSEEFGRKP